MTDGPLHSENPPRESPLGDGHSIGTCDHCGFEWPCPTVVTLAALHPRSGHFCTRLNPGTPSRVWYQDEDSPRGYWPCPTVGVLGDPEATPDE